MKFLKNIREAVFYYFKYRTLLKKGLFDQSLYNAVNKDVTERNMNAFKHFLLYGWREGRNPSQYFDVNYYLENNKDVKDSGDDPLLHYLEYGWKEGRNPSQYFDVTYYLKHNPEVELNEEEPLTHYILYGWKIGSNPSHLFNVNYYLEKNLDVKIVGIEPLYHYLRFGRYEQRACNDLYLDSNISDSVLNEDYSTRINNAQNIYSRNFQILEMSLDKHDVAIVFDLNIGGGTEKYTQEILIHKHSIVIRIIEVNSRSILLMIYENSNLILEISLKSIESLVVLFLQNKKVAVVYFNHLIQFSGLRFCKYIAKHHAHQVVFFFHDYYAICPSYNLIDYTGSYCKAELDIVNKCSVCIKSNNTSAHGYLSSKLKYSLDIKIWRERFAELFVLCDRIICFSKAGQDLVIKVFPNIEDKLIVEPHKLIIQPSIKVKDIQFNLNKQITVGVLGRLNHAKGKQVVNELIKKPMFRNGCFKLVVIGKKKWSLFSKYKVTGAYKLDKLGDVILQNKIDIFINTSIWPETYCYTADEIMAMGYPLVCFNIGAHAERVLNYSRGFVVDKLDADEMYKKIIHVAKYYGYKL